MQVLGSFISTHPVRPVPSVKRYNALRAMELAGAELGMELDPVAWGIHHLKTFDTSSSLAAKQQLDDEREQLMAVRMAKLRTMTVDALTVTTTRAS